MLELEILHARLPFLAGTIFDVARKRRRRRFRWWNKGHDDDDDDEAKQSKIRVWWCCLVGFCMRIVLLDENIIIIIILYCVCVRLQSSSKDDDQKYCENFSFICQQQLMNEMSRLVVVVNELVFMWMKLFVCDGIGHNRAFFENLCKVKI